MQISLLGKQKEKLSFVLKGCRVSFANALRRSAIEEVPTLAVKTVEFRKNTSVLYDEVVAHRLGLIPIKTDLKSYNLPEKCPCKGTGCAQCQLKLTVKEKGPKTVYASDIKSKDPKAKPVYGKTSIAKLLKGQSFEAEMTAMLGQGKNHSKWNPGSVYYKYLPEIKISKKGTTCLECVDICPQDVFVEKAKKLAINEKKRMNCHLCGACEEVSKGEVKVNRDVNEFVFFVESWGQLTGKEIMIKASEYLEEKLNIFGKEFNK